MRYTTHYIALLVLASLPSTSYAYLDPGTGSMILQGLIAGIAVAAMTIKQYWYRITAFFSKEPESDEEKLDNVQSNDE